MTKKEFLAMSFPYGLMFKNLNENTTEQLSGVDTYLVANCSHPPYPNGTIFVYSSIDHSSMWSINEIKLILRPLSDLTKEIEHKGEKFVPMIGLWKIVSKDGNDYKLTADSIEDRNAFVVFPKEDKSRLLGYHIPTNSFFGATNDKPCSVAKQLDLFQKLIEWHFDIADLISKGEAIDVNTLETNPYK